MRIEIDGTEACGIGDVTSDQPGTAARYNVGKAPFELVPLRSLVSFYERSAAENNEAQSAVMALECLAEWQAGNGPEWLTNALLMLGDGWVECAEVFAYGRKKYAAWNWAKGFEWSVPLACATRHLLAIIGGETTDPESSKTHRGHVYCNVVMLQTFVRTYPQGDDRTPLLRGAS